MKFIELFQKFAKGVCIIADVNMSSKTASFETLKLHMSTLAATVLHADDNTPRAQCCLLESRHIHGADNQTP